MLPTLWPAHADARVHAGECGVYVSGCMWLGSVSKVKGFHDWGTLRTCAIILALAVKQTHASRTHWMDLHTAGESTSADSRRGKFNVMSIYPPHKAYILGCVFGGTQTEICAFRFSGDGGWWDEAEFLRKPPSWSLKGQRCRFMLSARSHTLIQVVTVESEMPCRPWHAQHCFGSINQLSLNHLLWYCF